MTTFGLATALGVQWRVQRRRLLLYPAALGAALAGTAAAIARLYDTPHKIQTYASAASGQALVAVNGRVEGLDSLGGVIQNEFGFLAAFTLPLLGIAVVARATRDDEAAGRTETLLAARVGRQAPTLAALLLASGTVAATVAIFAVGLGLQGVPWAEGTLYAVSLGALALVFAAAAAVLAQVTRQARGVLLGGLLLLTIAYVLRGVGDVTDTWLAWASPLGWQERAAPFGVGRWWTLGVPAAVVVVSAGAALGLAGRRDVGSAWGPSRPGPAHASRALRSTLGLAARTQLSVLLGWAAGALLLAGTLGVLARQLLDAISGNAALAQSLGLAGSGASSGAAMEGFVAMTQVYVAVIATGYAVAAAHRLTAEESSGRLETQLAGAVPRGRWLGVHALVLLMGLVVIVTLASVALGVCAAWSLQRSDTIAASIGSGVDFLPAEALVASCALVVFSARPRVFPVVWLGYAVTTAIAFLGPGLRAPAWVMDLSPTHHVGSPPAEAVNGAGLVVLTALAVVGFVVAFLCFRRRSVPGT